MVCSRSPATLVYNLRFPGQMYLSETGLNYNYFRDYDPQVGRCVESDPIGLRGGSYSTYAYCNANPLTRADPDAQTLMDYAKAVAELQKATVKCRVAADSNRCLWREPGPGTRSSVTRSRQSIEKRLPKGVRSLWPLYWRRGGSSCRGRSSNCAGITWNAI